MTSLDRLSRTIPTSLKPFSTCFLFSRSAFSTTSARGKGIERLLLFSPLDETPEIRKLIESAKSAAEVERDTAVAELPERLRRDEEEVKSLETRLAGIATKVETTSATVGKIGDELDPICRSISDLATELRELTDAHARAKATTEDSVGELRHEIETFSQNTSARIAKLIDDVEQFSEMLSHLERVSSSTGALESRLDHLEKTVEERTSTAPSGSTTTGSEENATIRVRALTTSSAAPGKHDRIIRRCLNASCRSA